ncbi:MAG: peptidylprolyl isomerase, partial [Polyangiaceae bacterium]
DIIPGPDSGVVVEASTPVDSGPALYLPAGYELVPFLTDTADTHKFKQADAVIDVTKQYIVVLETDAGRIVWQLFPDIAPVACNSFVFLTLHHYFDGIAFHRVIEGFVAQGGDPNTIDKPQSTWGTGGPGYTFDNEILTDAFDVEGVVAMANTGQPKSNGSQFFITFSPQPSLDGGYTIFGKVIEGMDVLPKILRGEPPPATGQQAGWPTRMTEVHVGVKSN